MHGLGSNGHRNPSGVQRAMLRESSADVGPRLRMGNDVVEPESHPFELPRAGMDPHRIIVMQGPLEADAHLDDRIDVAVGLDLAIRIGGVAHQGGPSQFEIPQVIGMIYNGGAVRIGIERPVAAAMPDEPRRRITDITPVIAIRLRLEWFRFHLKPPERRCSSSSPRSRRRWKWPA